jgi:choline dehydrogenase-like flavoprotein
MSIAVARRLGGTSNLWGGRCLPYDPIDFSDRSFVDARWPIGYKDLESWIAPAVAATCSGRPIYRTEELAGCGLEEGFSCNTLERWVNVQAAQNVHADAIKHSPALDVRTHAALVRTIFAENGRVAGIEVANSLSGERATLPVSHLVLAAGGLETTRILLAAQRETPERFGGEDGPLGRYYMGHLIGEIADIVFANGEVDKAFDFYVDEHGSFVRRRIVPSAELQAQHALLNAAFWPVVPPVWDASHQSALLSLVYLALSSKAIGSRVVAEAIRVRHIPPGRPVRGPHVKNLVTGLPSALGFAAKFMQGRYLSRHRVPGFFVRNAAHRYGLSFHSEQLPNPDSRVTLSTEADRLGLPRLVIDYRFSDGDISSVVRTHDLLEDWLARTGLGRLEYRMAREKRADAILDKAAHGTHQIGLARMGSDRNNAVVDGELSTFDAPNLYLATSAVLPTSSQANPTLTTIALALRLSQRLDHLL